MNIINFSIEHELLGSRQLMAARNRSSSVSGLSKNPADIQKVSNVDNFTRKLPPLLKEKEYDISSSKVNKVFCAQWLDERRVLMGTKCNKLVTLDTNTGKYSVQNPLKSHKKSLSIPNHCGIHSISINPSRTLLATGAENVNDVAVYSLPDMRPVSVGYGAHSYWIFDTVWLDDLHVCSGAGDNRLALWKIENSDLSHHRSSVSSFINRSSSLNSSSSQMSSSSPSSSSNSRLTSSQPVTSREHLHRACKRTLPSSSSFSSLDSNVSLPASLSNLHSFNSAYSFLTNPSSFNTSMPNFMRQSTTRSYRPIRLRQNAAFVSYQNYLMNHHQDSNNNVAYFDITANFENINDESTAETVDLRIMSRNTNQNDSTANEVIRTRVRRSQNDTETDQELSAYFDEFNWSVPVEHITADDEHSDIDEESDSNDSLGNENVVFSEEEIDEEVEDESEDEDEDNNGNESVQFKRRRLNSKGKFAKPASQFQFNKPTKVIKCRQSKRIRAMAFNPKRNEIAAISMNAAFHYFDIHRFEQKYTKKLSPALKENVCLTLNDDYTIYAIGSASHVQLLDANNARQLVNPVFIKKDIGVRSVNFRNNILSIGTGSGSVLFYDLRVNKFLENEHELRQGKASKLKLQTNGGWILHNENYYDSLPYSYNADNSHAIYAHSYDPSGTKLLAAGGPLTVNFFGHYVGVWR